MFTRHQQLNRRPSIPSFRSLFPLFWLLNHCYCVDLSLFFGRPKAQRTTKILDFHCILQNAFSFCHHLKSLFETLRNPPLRTMEQATCASPNLYQKTTLSVSVPNVPKLNVFVPKMHQNVPKLNLFVPSSVYHKSPDCTKTERICTKRHAHLRTRAYHWYDTLHTS